MPMVGAEGGLSRNVHQRCRMRSAWWLVGFSIAMAVMVAGCPEDEPADEGNACVDNGVMNGLSDSCAGCGCANCAVDVENCQDAACQSVLSCGIAAGCSGNECYCGIGVAAGTCLTMASGPCMQQIVTASGVQVGAMGCMTVETCAGALLTATADMTNPLFRANKVAACVNGTPATMTAAAVPGMCMAECAQ